MNDNNDQHCETNKTTEKKITQMNEHQGEKKGTCMMNVKIYNT